MRLWGKEVKNNRILREFTAEVCSDDTRTHKIFQCISEICHELDLAEPIWLEGNIAEFKRMARTRFRRDSFMEDIDFDYLEIRVLEEN